MNAIEKDSRGGYCIDMFDGSVWLRQDLSVTHDYAERGVWPTIEQAEAARTKSMESFTPNTL